MTADITNLNISADEYSGNDQIQVGNDTGLNISHIGTSKFHAHSHSFLLDQILVVPSIQKNLISVQKFAKDNNVFFEFHDSYFLIKDYSGSIQHKGYVQDGLYCFSQPFRHYSASAFVATRVLISAWRNRLGHASFPIVQCVLSATKIPVVMQNRHIVCLDCQLAKSHNLPFSKSSFTASKPLELLYLLGKHLPNIAQRSNKVNNVKISKPLEKQENEE